MSGKSIGLHGNNTYTSSVINFYEAYASSFNPRITNIP